MNDIRVSSCFAKACGRVRENSQTLLMLLLSAALAALVVLPYAEASSASGSVGASLAGVPARFHGEVPRPGRGRNSLSAIMVWLGLPEGGKAQTEALGWRLAGLANLALHDLGVERRYAYAGLPFAASLPYMARSGLERQLARLMQVVRASRKQSPGRDALLVRELGRELLPPVSPVGERRSAAGFGWRIDPFTGTRAMHEGIDFTAPTGTSISALAGGVVVYSANHHQYGNMVEIDHGNGIVTRYAHASRLLVKVGQVVWRGEKIAEVGSTGRSTGSHLHFEVRYNGIAQNPVRFLQNAAS